MTVEDVLQDIKRKLDLDEIRLDTEVDVEIADDSEEGLAYYPLTIVDISDLYDGKEPIRRLVFSLVELKYRT